MKPSDFLSKNSISKEIIFDLDNTVYDENTFLFKKYKKLSEFVFKKTGVKSDLILNYLVENFLKNGRNNLFDGMIDHFSVKKVLSVDVVLNEFRGSEIGDLNFYSFFMDFLKNEKNIYIITNGNYLQQEQKRSLLRFSEFPCNLIFLCAENYEPKPSRASFDWLSSKHNLQSPLYIGDSDIDAKFSSNCGIPFAKLDFSRNDDGYVVEETIEISLN